MEVKVLIDSVNPYTNVRLTTLHCVYPQFIHQQVLTHRWFCIEPKDEKDCHYGGLSTNSSSLRAISFTRATKEFDIVYPSWTEEKKGMQGELVTDEITIDCANATIQKMFSDVLHGCRVLEDLGIHHQDINNYLRPFQNIHTVLSFTDIDNFFEQRLHESTKPDMQKLAQLMKEAYDKSDPKISYDHIPLLDDLRYSPDWSLPSKHLISAARLARISYFSWQDDPQKDLELAKKLLANKHLSPFEHIAFAQKDNNYYANFKSWKQLRHTL